MRPFTQHRTSSHTQSWHYLKSVHQIMYTDEKIEVVGSSIVYETQENQDSYNPPILLFQNGHRMHVGRK